MAGVQADRLTAAERDRLDHELLGGVVERLGALVAQLAGDHRVRELVDQRRQAPVGLEPLGDLDHPGLVVARSLGLAGVAHLDDVPDVAGEFDQPLEQPRVTVTSHLADGWGQRRRHRRRR